MSAGAWGMHAGAWGVHAGACGVEVRHRDVEDAVVEEKEGAEGLVLGRRGGVTLHGEMIEENGDLRGAGDRDEARIQWT
jgi:hypothetical protein